MCSIYSSIEQGLRTPAADAEDENEAVAMALKWKQLIHAFRAQQSASAPVDELGLKRVTTGSLAPHLKHVVNDK